MRRTLEEYNLLTKHADPDDRAWRNEDVRELVELCLALEKELARALQSAREWEGLAT